MREEKLSIKVRNLPKEYHRYVVARPDKGNLWFWGSWERYTDAISIIILDGFKDGVIFDTQGE